MFHNLPFPIFVMLGIGISLLMLYYAIQYGKKKEMLTTLIFAVFSFLGIITALQRCVEEWFPQTTFNRVLTVVQMAYAVFSILFVEGIAIVRYRREELSVERKKMFWIGTIGIILLLAFAAFIIIDIWTR